MNEFFADEIEFWSFSLSDTEFHLIINNSHSYYWREFFSDLEKGLDYELSRDSLIKKVQKSKFGDIEHYEMESLWDKFPYYFGSHFKANLDKLENDPIFLSLIRQIKLNKIID